MIYMSNDCENQIKKGWASFRGRPEGKVSFREWDGTQETLKGKKSEKCFKKENEREVGSSWMKVGSKEAVKGQFYSG